MERSLRGGIIEAIIGMACYIIVLTVVRLAHAFLFSIYTVGFFVLLVLLPILRVLKLFKSVKREVFDLSQKEQNRIRD